MKLSRKLSSSCCKSKLYEVPLAWEGMEAFSNIGFKSYWCKLPTTLAFEISHESFLRRWLSKKEIKTIFTLQGGNPRDGWPADHRPGRGRGRAGRAAGSGRLPAGGGSRRAHATDPPTPAHPVKQPQDVSAAKQVIDLDDININKLLLCYFCNELAFNFLLLSWQ